VLLSVLIACVSLLHVVNCVTLTPYPDNQIQFTAYNTYLVWTQNITFDSLTVNATCASFINFTEGGTTIPSLIVSAQSGNITLLEFVESNVTLIDLSGINANVTAQLTFPQQPVNVNVNGTSVPQGTDWSWILANSTIDLWYNLSGSNTTALFELDMSSFLTVALNSPASSTNQASLTVNFVFTPTSVGNPIQNATLYSNFNGTWLSLASTNAVADNVANTFVYTFPSGGTFVWNILVYNSTSGIFAPSNFTLTIGNYGNVIAEVGFYQNSVLTNTVYGIGSIANYSSGVSLTIQAQVSTNITVWALVNTTLIPSPTSSNIECLLTISFTRGGLNYPTTYTMPFQGVVGTAGQTFDTANQTVPSGFDAVEFSYAGWVPAPSTTYGISLTYEGYY